MTTNLLARTLRSAGQPLLLSAALALWAALGADAKAMPVSIIAVLATLLVLEQRNPRRRDWRKSGAEKAALIGAWILLGALLGLVTLTHERWLATLVPPGAHLALWPQALPWPIQALLLFLTADGMYYWVHRAIHRWPWLWRISGHGVHHAFHDLHAVHAGVTHPFELLLLALPLASLGTLFAAPPEAVAAATLMLSANAQIVHANVELGCPGLRWLITTGADHRLHHSMLREQSDRNFACNAILWDRIFGTHAEGEVAQTGTGPRQPGMLALLALPFRKPGR